MTAFVHSATRSSPSRSGRLQVVLAVVAGLTGA